MTVSENWRNRLHFKLVIDHTLITGFSNISFPAVDDKIKDLIDGFNLVVETINHVVETLSDFNRCLRETLC